MGSLYAGVDDIEPGSPPFIPISPIPSPSMIWSAPAPLRNPPLPGAGGGAGLFRRQSIYPLRWWGLPHGAHLQRGTSGGKTHPSAAGLLCLRPHPFLALSCGELITIDLRYFMTTCSPYVDWLEPDVVLVMYTAGSLALDPLFDFFPAGDFCLDTYQSAPPIAQKPEL